MEESSIKELRNEQPLPLKLPIYSVVLFCHFRFRSPLPICCFNDSPSGPEAPAEHILLPDTPVESAFGRQLGPYKRHVHPQKSLVSLEEGGDSRNWSLSLAVLLRKLPTLDATAHAAHIFMEVNTCLQYGGSWLDSAFRGSTLGIGSSGQGLYSSYFLSTHLFGDLPPLTYPVEEFRAWYHLKSTCSLFCTSLDLSNCNPIRGSLGFGVQQSPT
eukprot:Gb_24060 [translate_table: standard]